jgi:DNA polymerase (family 10)
MKNQLVASLLNQVADLMEMDSVDFRTKAYRRAAHTVEIQSEAIEDIREEGKLQDLPGIGDKIARKIEEIIDTGSLKYLENLKEEFPVDYDELMTVEGLGPKGIKQLYQELGVKSLDDLEKQAKNHRIRRLKGMGEKTERNILINLDFAKKSGGRSLIGEILPVARKIKKLLKSHDNVERVEIAGSIRRMKETVGDIDVLVTTTQPLEVMDFFTRMDMVDDVVVSGPTKSTIRLKENGMDVDIRTFTDESFGSALMYFTGSKETNVELRKLAISLGYKLNEYGVFDRDQLVAGTTEKEVFNSLGMDYIEPELRENTGEIQAAINRTLPQLVELKEIKGDLQMHTNWSDGKNSIEELAFKCQKMGYEYIAITDHSKDIKSSQPPSEKQIKKQMDEIDTVNKKLDGLTVLKGVEANIDSYGYLDVPDKLLEAMDIVVAGIHSGFNQNQHELTRRMVAAISNEHVNIISHPTGREIHGRNGYELEFEKIFEASTDNNTLLEVNSRMNRLDLNDMHIKQAVENGVKLAINTDSHSINELVNMELGVGTARRGWAKKEDVINTLNFKELLSYLKN